MRRRPLTKWDVGAKPMWSDPTLLQNKKTKNLIVCVRATQIITTGRKEPMTSVCGIWVFCVGENRNGDMT